LHVVAGDSSTEDEEFVNLAAGSQPIRPSFTGICMKLERAEFEKLAIEQMDSVDRVARSLTRNGAEADDLVQETYLRAFRAADNFELQSFGIRPWLLRILHNVHVTRATRESRQPKAIEAEHLQAIEDPTDESAVFTAMPGQFTGMDSELDQAMEQLPTELQTVLTLWAVDELSYREIAEATGVPIGTVMSRLHRARQKLAQRLQEVRNDPGALRD
jgi:RNA polymerase sigma-70 factor (ECF subfamily)